MVYRVKGFCHMCKGQGKFCWKELVTAMGLCGIKTLIQSTVKLMIICWLLTNQA